MPYTFMSAAMRDILIQHVDGTPVPIIQPSTIEDAAEAQRAGQLVKSQGALMARGLIRFNVTNVKFKPTHTVITNAGRAALRKVLAEYADILVKSGYRVEELRHAAGHAFGKGIIYMTPCPHFAPANKGKSVPEI